MLWDQNVSGLLGISDFNKNGREIILIKNKSHLWKGLKKNNTNSIEPFLKSQIRYYSCSLKILIYSERL